MAAYVLVDLEITDPENYERYRAAVPDLIKKYKGRYLVRGGDVEVLEGDWQPRRVVVLEFPSMDDLKKFYDSEDYRDLKAARIAATNTNLIAVEGV
jgi:uncharacterized protein (DUF1330 family)